jgi:hypothetical protein
VGELEWEGWNGQGLLFLSQINNPLADHILRSLRDSDGGAEWLC